MKRNSAKRKDSVGKAIRIQQLDLDIINLVEVEDCTVLQMLQSAIGDPTYKYYLLKGTDTATGQNVGLLTRIDPTTNLQRTSNRFDYPIAGSKCGSSTKGDSAVSKHYYTRFDIQNLDGPLIMIGTHFLAFPDDPSRCSQREAQASVLRQLAQEQAIDNGYNYIILGDLNDFDSTFLDAANDVPISQVLQILKSNEKGAITMTNVASQITPQSARWSCWWDQNGDCEHSPHEHSLIDHILVSNSMSNYVADVGVALDLFNGSCNSYESDHWPVWVQFNL